MLTVAEKEVIERVYERERNVVALHEDETEHEAEARQRGMAMKMVVEREREMERTPINSTKQCFVMMALWQHDGWRHLQRKQPLHTIALQRSVQMQQVRPN